MAQPSKRPIAPHLTDGMSLHWRWGPGMFVSILHRVTGDGMALVGLPVLLWWLYSVVAGAAAYETFQGFAGAWYGKVVLFGLTWSFLSHLSSGIRHFVLDVGAGYELDTNNTWSLFTPLIPLSAAIGVWTYLLLR